MNDVGTILDFKCGYCMYQLKNCYLKPLILNQDCIFILVRDSNTNKVYIIMLSRVPHEYHLPTRLKG